MNLMEIILIIIVLLSLFFDYTNGFHDAANVVSTVIATRALRPLSAIVMASVLNFLGATQISGVAQTIADGLIQAGDTTQIVMLCAILGAIVWNLATWYFGIPSSSSYALIGALIGASWIHRGHQTILWPEVFQKVFLPMLASPLIGFLFGLGTMKLLFSFLSKRPSAANLSIFKHLQIGSAGIVALAHGLNDAQKSMGFITLSLFSAGFIQNTEIPFWVILSCALAMGLGTATGGFRIIQTMGFSITNISSVQGFAAETSTSAVILAASFFGMPVSSTHVITGSITGVGTAKGRSAVRWNVPQKLLVAWILTFPGSALTAAFFYLLLHSFFH